MQLIKVPFTQRRIFLNCTFSKMLLEEKKPKRDYTKRLQKFSSSHGNAGSEFIP